MHSQVDCNLTKRILLPILINLCSLLMGDLCYAMTQQEQHEALSIHNQLRANHNTPALTWDNQLAEYAENYAKDCHFKHSHGEYGENLAAGYPTITRAIKSWYNENKLYSYDNPGFSSQTGHFTQLVWKSSTKLGCALIQCDGKNGTPGNYLICEYNPPGNITNEPYFRENVITPA